MSPGHKIKPTDRLIILKPGDSLEALCQQVYGDSSLSGLVAEYNGLDHFRDPPAGTQLVFPPLPRA